MKIFAVYAKVELTEKPDWLDEFRKKYDKPYEYHLTLKQPCLIEEVELVNIKNKLESLFSNLKIPDHVITSNFDSLKISKEGPDNVCVMLVAPKHLIVEELQRKILSVLNGYSQYYKPKYKAYEENFEPHITIGRNLSEQSYQQALKELEQGYACRGVITQVVMVAVKHKTVAEANDPDNRTVYNLDTFIYFPIQENRRMYAPVFLC